MKPAMVMQTTGIQHSVRHRRTAAVASLAVILGLSVGSDPGFAKDQTLRVSYAAPTVSLDAQRVSSALSAGMLKHVFEQLTATSADGNVEGILATSWKVSPDGKTWTFSLRRGVTFHDGTKFDAHAVKENFSRIFDPKEVIPTKDNLGPISSVDVVDDYTINITTSVPFSGLALGLSHYVGSMISPTALRKFGNASGSNPLAGTGPYRIGQFSLPDTVTLERNNDYWGKKGEPAKIVFKSATDGNSRLASLLSGDADVNIYISSTDQARLKTDNRFTVRSALSIRVYMLPFPMKLEEFQDIRVRRALNLAVDRKQIVNTIFQGAAQATDSSISPGVVGYQPNAPFEYDPNRARALLEEAGWKKNASGILERNGKPFSTIKIAASRGRYPNDERVAQAVIGYFKAIGVPTTLQLDEPATFFTVALKQARAENWMLLIPFGFPQFDGAAFLCKVYDPSNANNFGSYAGSQIAQRCGKIDSTFDQKERSRLIAEGAKAVYEDIPALYILSPQYLIAERKGLTGVELNGGEFHTMREATLP